jgi:hypothetical protein
MKAVFKAVTLSFLIAAIFQALASGFAYLDIYLLDHWDRDLGKATSFKLSVVALSLHACLLCVVVLVAAAFAKRQIEILQTHSLISTALWVSVPISLLSQLSAHFESSATWAPYLLLIFTLGWATMGLYFGLWRYTEKPLRS